MTEEKDNERSGIPFMCNNTGKRLENIKEQGFRVSLLIESHSGDYSGVLIGGLYAGIVAGYSLDNPGCKKLYDIEQKGFVTAGGFANVLDDSKGVVIAGGMSLVNGDQTGFVGSGIISTVDGNQTGVCVSGIGSIIDSSIGVIAAGGLNAVNKDLEGLAVSTIANMVHGDVTGVMIGSCNYVGGLLTGYQGGLINYSKESDKVAVQTGLVNIIDKYDSEAEDFVLQIGLYNRAGNQAIPLVNMRGFRNLHLGEKIEGLAQDFVDWASGDSKRMKKENENSFRKYEEKEK